MGWVFTEQRDWISRTACNNTMTSITLSELISQFDRALSRVGKRHFSRIPLYTISIQPLLSFARGRNCPTETDGGYPHSILSPQENTFSSMKFSFGYCYTANNLKLTSTRQSSSSPRKTKSYQVLCPITGTRN